MKKSFFKKTSRHKSNTATHRQNLNEKKRNLTQIRNIIQGSQDKAVIVAKPLSYDTVAPELHKMPMGTRIGVLEYDGVKTLVPYSKVIEIHMKAAGTAPLTMAEALLKFEDDKKQVIVTQVDELSSRGIKCYFGLRSDGLVSIRTDEGAGIWGGPPLNEEGA